MILKRFKEKINNEPEYVVENKNYDSAINDITNQINQYGEKIQKADVKSVNLLTGAVALACGGCIIDGLGQVCESNITSSIGLGGMIIGAAGLGVSVILMRYKYNVQEKSDKLVEQRKQLQKEKHEAEK